MAFVDVDTNLIKRSLKELSAKAEQLRGLL